MTREQLNRLKAMREEYRRASILRKQADLFWYRAQIAQGGIGHKMLIDQMEAIDKKAEEIWPISKPKPTIDFLTT